MKKTTLALTAVVALIAHAAFGQAFSWKQKAGEEVTVMMPEHPVTDGIRTLLADFESETGMKVNLQTMAEDLYFDRMEVALRSSSGVADAYFLPMDSTAFTQYKAGLIKPLSPYIDDPKLTARDYDIRDFPPGFLDTTRYPGGTPDSQYYGIPASFEVYILMYNKKLVDEYLGGAVPETMPDLLKAAAKIKEDSGGRVAGAVMRGIRSDTLIDTISGVVFNSWGNPDAVRGPYGVWFDGNWSSPRLTDDKVMRGLSDYAELMKAGPINILSIDWPDAEQVFKQGRAAFFIDASLFAPGFESSDSPLAGNVGYALIPPHRAGDNSYSAHWGWGYGVPANAQNPEAGWLFIQYMSNKSAEPRIGKLHWGAVRKSTQANPEYTAALNPEFADVVGSAMATSRTSVVFREGFSEFALRIVDAIQAMYGGESAASAAESANNDFGSMVN